jgi:hypothetical protein
MMLVHNGRIPLLFAENSPARADMPANRGRTGKLALLTVALLMTAGIGLAVRVLAIAPSASTAAPAKVTISIEDIQRQVDVKSLPVSEVAEPF